MNGLSLRALVISALGLSSAGCGSESLDENNNSANGGSSGAPSASGGSAGANTGGSAGANTGGSAGGASAGTSGSGPAAGSGGGALEPPPGQYGTRPELLDANSEMAVAAVGTKIYVLGGYPQSRETMPTVLVYDTTTSVWDRSEPLPFAVHHPVAVGVNGKLYSLGGQTVAGDTHRVVVFDPAAGGPWQELTPMPTARGAGAAAVIDDKIYVAGGRPEAGNAFEVYDISDDAWTPLPDLPDADHPNRNHIAATAIGGKVYVTGGRHSGGSFMDPMTDKLDVFDPVMGMWAPAAPMLRPRGGVNGIAAFGCFYVWGGEGADIGEPNNVFPDHDVYNPLTDSWTELASLPTPIHGVTGAAFIDGLIFMPGGGIAQGGSSGSTLFQVYRPEMTCE